MLLRVRLTRVDEDSHNLSLALSLAFSHAHHVSFFSRPLTSLSCGRLFRRLAFQAARLRVPGRVLRRGLDVALPDQLVGNHLSCLLLVSCSRWCSSPGKLPRYVQPIRPNIVSIDGARRPSLPCRHRHDGGCGDGETVLRLPHGWLLHPGFRAFVSPITWASSIDVLSSFLSSLSRFGVLVAFHNSVSLSPSPCPQPCKLS